MIWNVEVVKSQDEEYKLQGTYLYAIPHIQ